MFPNLNAEIARAGMTVKELAVSSDMKYDTLLNKLTGKTEFTRQEMFVIKKVLKVTIVLEDLFATEDALISTA